MRYHAGVKIRDYDDDASRHVQCWDSVRVQFAVIVHRIMSDSVDRFKSLLAYIEYPWYDSRLIDYVPKYGMAIFNCTEADQQQKAQTR